MKKSRPKPCRYCARIICSRLVPTSRSDGVYPRTFDIGRVRQQQQNSFFAVGGEALEVEHLAFHRRVVDLEIAGMDDRAHGSFDGKGETVHQAVSHANALNAKRRDVPWRAGSDLMDVRGIFQVVFFELVCQ